VPEKVRVVPVNVSQPGNALPSARVADNVNVSPASTSAKVFSAKVKVNAKSSVALWSAIGFATVGALLELRTVSVNVSLTLALLLSVIVTLTDNVPTSEFNGVPEKVRVAPVNVSQDGNALPSAP